MIVVAMNIEIGIHCWNFQHRLTWMLSSILQQNLKHCKLQLNIAYIPNNGSPKTESIIECFEDHGLHITKTILDQRQILKRSISRNILLRDSKADYILFADSDIVYHPDFFEYLYKRLTRTRIQNESRVMGADRYSLEKEFCINFFKKNPVKEPKVIDNVADIVSNWPVWQISDGRYAAGYFQLVNTKKSKEKTQFYCEDNEIDNISRHKFISDMQFRKNMGGRRKIITKPQYHLNHERKRITLQK